MYGRKGKLSPSYIDGRKEIPGDIWRKIALLNKPSICEICGTEIKNRRLHVHHKDKDRSNNNLDNLQVVCVCCHNNILHPRKRDQYGRFIKEVV
jgi:5-methylcytosine-specific restriction endonuclease McrA